MSISQGFKIQNFHEFHDIYGGLQVFLKKDCEPSSSKIPNKPSPFVVLQCKFVDKRYVEPLILQNFGININMQIMICFFNIPNKVFKKVLMHYFLGTSKLYEKLTKHI
jgi:hypothetical protein